MDPQVLAGGQRGEAGGEQAVDVALAEARVLQGVVGRLGVVLQGRLVGHRAHLVGLRHANDGDLTVIQRR